MWSLIFTNLYSIFFPLCFIWINPNHGNPKHAPSFLIPPSNITHHTLPFIYFKIPEEGDGSFPKGVKHGSERTKKRPSKQRIPCTTHNDVDDVITQ